MRNQFSTHRRRVCEENESYAGLCRRRCSQRTSYAVYIFWVLGFFLFLVFFSSPVSAQDSPVAVQCLPETQNDKFTDLVVDDEGEPVVSRCIECDVCGYCFTQAERNLEMPDDWADCARCIYPDVFEPLLDVSEEDGGIGDLDDLDNEDALRNLTLHIRGDGEGGVPEAPRQTPGRYYSQLGCFSTNTDDYFDAFAGGAGAGGSVSQILRILFSVVGGLAFLYLMYGAFVYMTAEGRPERVQQARGIITGSIVGVIFSLSAVLIVNIVGNQFLGVPIERSPVDISYESRDDGSNDLVVNPRDFEFEIMEIYYTGEGEISCADSMTELVSGDVEGRKLIVCYPSGTEPFSGSAPLDVAVIPEGVEVDEILLDGEFRAD